MLLARASLKKHEIRGCMPMVLVGGNSAMARKEITVRSPHGRDCRVNETIHRF